MVKERKTGKETFCRHCW